MKIKIVGAGIGGLVAGLALHARGHLPVLYETVDKLEELGIGINLLPHACRVLADLCVDTVIRETGVETSELLYFDKFGQRIWQEPRGLAAGYPWPSGLDSLQPPARHPARCRARTARRRRGQDRLSPRHCRGPDVLAFHQPPEGKHLTGMQGRCGDRGATAFIRRCGPSSITRKARRSGTVRSCGELRP